MTSGKERILSRGPQRKILSEEQVARSVVVTNLKRQTSGEEIVIYFQQAKNGGGELDYVHIPHKGKAVITFASKEVAEKISENQHNIDGSELKFHPLVCAEPVKVFGSLEARLNPGILRSLGKDGQSVKKALEETGVYARNGYVLSGSLPQIQALSDKLLQNVACVKEGKENTGATGNSHLVSPRNADTLFSESSSYFEVQPQFMKLLQKVHKNTISKMEQRFAVQIFWKKNTSQVLVHPARKTSNGNDSFKEGCDKFIDLYKNFIQNVSRNVIQPPSEAGGEVIDKTISAFQEDNPAVCEREGNTVVLYAEKDRSLSLDRVFKERLHSILESNRRGKITNQGSFNNQHLQSIPYSQPLGYVQLRNGVLFSLYHADITSVKVDAIVNAANEHLQHGGGVAAAIVRSGGRQIQHESNDIVKRLGPIPVGQAVETSGGRLPCQYVIHTVGPRWNEQRKEASKSLLRQACLASLNLAAMRLHLSSIALTAISSGLFGMPKDISAQVIFKAVEEFSESEYAEVSCLRDVRIVIIDEPTIRVFYEEFIKRYSSKGALAEDFSNSGHPQNKEKQNSFILNPPEDVRKAQKNDSAGNGNQYSDKLKNNAKSPGQATIMNKESCETDLSDIFMKMSLSNANGKGNAESTSASDHMRAERKNFNLPSVKSASSGNESVTGMSAHGRGRGKSKFAPTFQKSPGGEKDLTLTNAKSSAPGLTVTDEGKDFAKHFNNTQSDNEETRGTDSVQSKGKSSGSGSQDADPSLKLHGDAKAIGEAPTEGSSNGAKGKERNPSQCSKHENTSSNDVKRGNSTQTDSVVAETQDSGTSAGESGIKNASSKTAGSVKGVQDKRTKNICEGKVNNGKEPMDRTTEEIHISNQATTHSSSSQFQPVSPSVEPSRGSEDNGADSSPGPQLAKTSGSSSQGVDQSLELNGEVKASGEPPTEGSSNWDQGKERNPSQSPKHDDTSLNHVRHGNLTQTGSVAAETQNSGTAAGEIVSTNSSFKNTGSIMAVHDKNLKNFCHGKVNDGKEQIDCTQKETHTSNQVETPSSPPQFQTSSPSVKQSSGSEDNAVDWSPGQQLGSVKAVRDKRCKNSCEGKVNYSVEPMDCTQEETHTSNQVVTHSSSPQFQTSSPSVEQSSGNENNAADSRHPGPQ